MVRSCRAEFSPCTSQRFASRGLCHVYLCYLYINRDTTHLCLRQTRRQQSATPCTAGSLCFLFASR